MMNSIYLPPVDQLLKLGEPEIVEAADWPDYLKAGFGPEHVHELIRLALDRSLDEAEEDDPAGWGHIHAWRALGQLRAVEAIRPLMRLFSDLNESEWMFEELPDAYAMIGPPAIAPLADYLVDEEQPGRAREAAAECLVKIAEAHPDWRGECVDALVRSLEQFADNDSDLNAFLVADLIELEAKEAAPVIERAYQAGLVAEDLSGDWEDVQVALGLKARRESERAWSMPPPMAEAGREPRGFSSGRKSEDAKAKAKRKQAEKSRKQNRKKKKHKK